MCPFFFNKVVPIEVVPKHMRPCGVQAESTETGKNLWARYLQRGCWCTRLCCSGMYWMIDYQPAKIFPCFMEQVTEACRRGDVEKSKALLAEKFKLLGNSGYGKLVKALEWQTNIIYTKDEKVVDRALRSAYFSDLDEIGQA